MDFFVLLAVVIVIAIIFVGLAIRAFIVPNVMRFSSCASRALCRKSGRRADRLSIDRQPRASARLRSAVV